MENSNQDHENGYFNVAEGVWGLKDIFVNVFFISNPQDQSWVLLDAGLKTSYEKIKDAAAKLFGENTKPSGIVLTHGHFDHVGSLTRLAEEWNVPIYAHHLELPYLTGKSDYPPADSSVGGGLMSLMADLYPNTPIDLSGMLKSLPFSQEIAVLPEWKYIHTPGHAPGHISLWREKDKVLLVGDAFVTTKQESAFSVLTQAKVLSGPPKYFTCDWQLAKESVDALAKLQPEVVATGHGAPMYGEEMREDLAELARDFEHLAVPAHGRYVSEPAVTNKYGVVSLPEPKSDLFSKISLICAATAVAGFGIAMLTRSRRKKNRF